MIFCLRPLLQSSFQQQKLVSHFTRRRFVSGSRKLQNDEASKSSNGINSKVEDNELWIGTHVWRLACAFGFVYVTTEYVTELTICEGPSMLPTIRPQGEIVLLDRLTPRLNGLQGGCCGSERARLARQKQKRHEKRLLTLSKSYTKENMTWHEPMIPVNELPSDGAYRRLWTRLTTGISVGDMVVVQHPDRVGTVCKRVLGLPGDMVTKPSMRARKQGNRLRRRRSGMVVVPDGHVSLILACPRRNR